MPDDAMLTLKLDDSMTLDADARTVTVTRTSLIEGLSVFCTFRDAAGESTNFDCQISSAGITALETVFDNVNDLPDLALVAGSSPATITLQDQTVVRIAASSGRIHTAWAGADALGDGRYRCLFRLPQDAASVLDRRFGFSARIARSTAGDWNGIRLEVYETGGSFKLHLREYTGVGGNTRLLATQTASWTYGVWHWLELEIAGSSVKGRVYPEGGDAPDWQLMAAVVGNIDGAFGPHMFPANTARHVDIRRIAFFPNF